MEAKTLRRRLLTAAALLFVAAALLVGGIATYAWFTSNQRVSTSRVMSRTGEENISLLVSTLGGADFKGGAECAIGQLNASSAEYLLPVSTADLTHFVAGAAYQDGMPTQFAPVENEADYYHGRIYLRAEANGLAQGSSLSLYLDRSQSGSPLVRKDDGSLLLNAARLGLIPEGSAPVIFYLSDETNPEDERRRNTILNGELLEEGRVLDGSVSPVVSVPDPAVPLSARSLNADGSLGTPLAVLEFGRIYALDIYFYLEGCDPDCFDSIYFDGTDLQLAFYGVLR